MKTNNNLSKTADLFNCLSDESNLLLIYLLAAAPNCQASLEQLAEATGNKVQDTFNKLSQLATYGLVKPTNHNTGMYTLSSASYDQVSNLLDMVDIDEELDSYYNKLLKLIETENAY